MKQILLSLAVLFATSVANAQDVFKLGTTVKGKHVTYEVKHIVTLYKPKGPSDLAPLAQQAAMLKEWFPDKKNVGLLYCSAEPNSQYQVDTVQKEIPYRGVVKRGFFEDLSMQIGIILHDHLSEAEVAELNEKERKNKPFGENAGVVLRVDSTKRKVLQVTCFLFYNHYVAARDRAARGWQREGDPVAYDGFWLNFDPDRLYAIEKDIVKRLVLPEDTPEMYLNDDFEVYVCPDQILDPEKAKAKKEAEEAEQKASREYWQKRNQMYKL